MGVLTGNWEPYYEHTRSKPPHEIVVEAAGCVVNRGRAIDIGAGALNDTRYLLEQGYEVTAIDGSELMLREAALIDSERFQAFQTNFVDFDFKPDAYDLASAQYSLPFNPPESYDLVFDRIVASLVPRGVFCGVLFGNHDTWASNPAMTFHSRARAEARLAGLEVIKFDEREEDGSTAVGTSKHWHVFDFIVRKP